VSGTVASGWVESPGNPGGWDRHIKVTVTNPIAQPVILGYANTWSTQTSYTFQVHETDGLRLGPGESATVEAVLRNFRHDPFNDPTWQRALTPPDALYSVEFRPVSAPDLLCLADNPGDTKVAPRRPKAPVVYTTAEGPGTLLSGDGKTMPVRFRTVGWFPGTIRVTYRMHMRDGSLREFTADLSENYQGTGMEAEALHKVEDLRQSDSGSSAQPPWFQGITKIEWNGQTKSCAETGSSHCAPADGSLQPTRWPS
jgi:hypothetical protein